MTDEDMNIEVSPKTDAQRAEIKSAILKNEIFER